MRKLLFVLIMLLLALLVGGCASNEQKGLQKTDAHQSEQAVATTDQSAGVVEPQPGDVVVHLANMRFTPQEIKVKLGARVVFVNDDSMEHDIVHDAAGGNSLFTSPKLYPGQSWSYTATQRGLLPIKCVFAGHYALGMVGTLVVE